MLVYHHRCFIISLVMSFSILLIVNTMIFNERCFFTSIKHQQEWEEKRIGWMPTKNVFVMVNNSNIFSIAFDFSVFTHLVSHFNQQLAISWIWNSFFPRNIHTHAHSLCSCYMWRRQLSQHKIDNGCLFVFIWRLCFQFSALCRWNKEWIEREKCIHTKNNHNFIENSFNHEKMD